MGDPAAGLPDGFCFDAAGRLYAAGSWATW